jgi:hypothetical protein
MDSPELFIPHPDKAYVPTFRVRREGVDVMVTLQVVEDGGEMICGLRHIEGEIDLPPRAMMAAFSEELAKIERIARDAGCAEMRHSGDDRKWFLPGYEPMAELKNGRRKRLLNG